MRIAGTIIPTEKKLHISLRYIFGIGPKRAMDVCAETKISPDKRVKDLTPEEEALLISAMQQYVLETDLRREISSDIKRLQDMARTEDIDIVVSCLYVVKRQRRMHVQERVEEPL